MEKDIIKTSRKMYLSWEFLTAVLNTPMSIVGVIDGIAESTASILKVISGWLLIDREKEKLAHFLDRFGKGLRTSARDALIADSTGAEFRGNLMKRIRK